MEDNEDFRSIFSDYLGGPIVLETSPNSFGIYHKEEDVKKIPINQREYIKEKVVEMQKDLDKLQQKMSAILKYLGEV